MSCLSLDNIDVYTGSADRSTWRKLRPETIYTRHVNPHILTHLLRYDLLCVYMVGHKNGATLFSTLATLEEILRFLHQWKQE